MTFLELFCHDKASSFRYKVGQRLKAYNIKQLYQKSDYLWFWIIILNLMLRIVFYMQLYSNVHFVENWHVIYQSSNSIEKGASPPLNLCIDINGIF